MKKQALNPFLPLWEYIPDGEPHVFDGRLYLFGSHDTEGGSRYCAEQNYVGWSAPLDDLSDWRYEGVLYESGQDPAAGNGLGDLYAPDVVRGNDGRYYLYYGLSGGVNSTGDDHNTPIRVAVSGRPAGPYEFYGFVRNPDGSPFLEYLPSDPAVLNDDGVIRLYYGWSFSMVSAAAYQGVEVDELPPMPPMTREALDQLETQLFHRTAEEMRQFPEDIMGANTVELEDDMLTVRGHAKRIVPGAFASAGSSFAGHAFYEAASIRKIGGTYYFIYSSENSNELCYAVSPFPDREFVYGGTIISNGDVGYQGRRNRERVNQTGNDHGSLECINGQWYIFHHRHTHNSTYSRQACAEAVTIAPDGHIAQVPITSCGLNGGPLKAEGSYPAPICCQLTNGHMPHITNRVGGFDIPFITHSGEGESAERFLSNLKEGCKAVYKYFGFTGPVRLTVRTRGAAGTLSVALDDQAAGEIPLPTAECWTESSLVLDHTGTAAFSLTYHGAGPADLLEFTFTAP